MQTTTGPSPAQLAWEQAQNEVAMAQSVAGALGDFFGNLGGGYDSAASSSAPPASYGQQPFNIADAGAGNNTDGSNASDNTDSSDANNAGSGNSAGGGDANNAATGNNANGADANNAGSSSTANNADANDGSGNNANSADANNAGSNNNASGTENNAGTGNSSSNADANDAGTGTNSAPSSGSSTSPNSATGNAVSEGSQPLTLTPLGASQVGGPPASFGIPIPDISGPTPIAWQGPEDDAIHPSYPEGAIAGAGAAILAGAGVATVGGVSLIAASAGVDASSTIDQTANTLFSQRDVYGNLYSTALGETVKATAVEQIATNAAINAGVATIPYVGPAVAPFVATGTRYFVSQGLGAAVDAGADAYVHGAGLVSVPSRSVGFDNLPRLVPPALLTYGGQQSPNSSSLPPYYLATDATIQANPQYYHLPTTPVIPGRSSQPGVSIGPPP